MTKVMSKKHFLSYSFIRNFIYDVRYCFTGNIRNVGEFTKPQDPLIEFQHEENESNDKRIIKIAIIGLPNVGKSTLINQIVGRRVFAMSKRVHTTQCKARAIHAVGNTQMVFLDTPGLVTLSESIKFKLANNFMSDGEGAIKDADVVGVMHDISNSYTRTKLDSKILRLLHYYPKKNTALILNKIDCVKRKRLLLDLANKLTCNVLSNEIKPVKETTREKISDKEMKERLKNATGWPGFQEVFMVSAIDGFGVGDIVEYLIKIAQPGPWLFPEDAYTDQKMEKIIEEAVRSKLLDYVPQEMPYLSKVKLEFLNDEDGKITAGVLVLCPSPRVEKLIRGASNGKIRVIREAAQDDLQNTFQQTVNLSIAVTSVKSANK
uniref:GTPase Era, mitochondrial n=1 Tax=Clastoptera arizonana TaxID=38151 RepID=A0A1B6CJJ9_9HEMI